MYPETIKNINCVLKMFVFLIMIVGSAVATKDNQIDPVDQILLFKEKTKVPIGTLTTSSGIPVPYSEASSTLNKPLINNNMFMDSITSLSRERIPERLVHARGAGAFGYFKVTHDVLSHICESDFVQRVGQKTPVAVRFSTVVGEKGSSELVREVRGFSVKFYTKDGNFDIPGFDTPIYFYKDPQKFGAFVHALRRNPASHLFDLKTYWDILTLAPEAMFMFLYIFSDRGIPDGFRHMAGFGIHTYQVNKCGVNSFVRFHILPDAGIKSLTTEEARNISATDLDYMTRDLYRAIGNGNFPSYTVKVQILSESRVKELKRDGLDVFDVTKTIPTDLCPLQKLGVIVLNRNPKNFFAEVEQMAFCPSNVIRGILGAPDKVYESRRVSYRDAQYYRLGANFNKIPVNCPFQVKTLTYNRDGNNAGDNEQDIPNYYPNSFNGPVPYEEYAPAELISIIESKPDNFKQAGDFYGNELSADERNRLVKNMYDSLSQVPKWLQDKAIGTFKAIHHDLAFRVAEALNGTKCN